MEPVEEHIGSWMGLWAQRLWYLILSALIAWAVYLSWKITRYLFSILSDLFVMWNIMFGRGKHSAQKNLRLHPYFCETQHLDEVTVREIYNFLENMVASEKGTIEDLHRVILRYSHVMLCREKMDGSLRGMSLVGVERKGDYTLLKSGLAVFMHQYRGGPYIYLVGAYLSLKELIVHPRTPVYVIGKSFSYKSYLIATKFSECYPVYNKETPEFFRKVLMDYAETVKTPSETFNSETFVLERELSAVKEHAATLAEEDLKNPHIRFFTERNPGWRKGHCMLLVFRLSGLDLLRCITIGLGKTKKGGGSVTSVTKELQRKSSNKPPLYKRMTFQDPLANKYAVQLYEWDCFGDECVLTPSAASPPGRFRFLSTEESETHLNVPIDLKM